MNEDDAKPRPPPDLLTAVEDMCRDVLHEVAAALNDIRQGRLNEAKNVGTAVRDLRAAFHLVAEERGKLEKLRKQELGIVHGYALDFDRARDEIARRLDRLGRARGD
jgi:hypothetical protein